MKQYRYIYSSMTNEDLDGYFAEMPFSPIDREYQRCMDGHWRWVQEQASEPVTEAEIEQDIQAHVAFGMTEEEAREYIMERVEEC